MNIQTRNLMITDEKDFCDICHILYSDVLDETNKLQFAFHSFYSVPNSFATIFSFSVGYKTFAVTELYLSNEFFNEIGHNPQNKIPSIKKLRNTYPQTSLLAAKQIIDNVIFYYDDICTVLSAQKKFEAGKTQTLPYFPNIFYYATPYFFVVSKEEAVFNPYTFFYHPDSGYCGIISYKN